VVFGVHRKSRSAAMKNLQICLLLCAIACAGVTQGGTWRMDELKRQAAQDLECSADALNAYESASQQYSVRGCGKRGLYRLQTCNRVTRECIYVLQGAVTGS
jgi:hypothetical protein